MKTAGIVLVALVAGTLLGWTLARRASPTARDEAAIHEAAKPGATAGSDPQLSVARKRIAELEEQLRIASSAAPVSRDTPPQGNVAEIRSRAQALLAAKNGAGLGALLRELSRLGPDGYAAVAALLAMVEQKGYREIGLEYAEYAALYSTLEPSCLEWIVEHPQAGGTEVRRQTTSAYASIFGQKAGPQLLGWLAKEPDAEIAWTLAMHLKFAVSPEMVGDLARVVRAHAGDQPVVAMVMETLGAIEDPASEEALALFAGDTDSAIREAARIELLARHPPVAGMLVTGVASDEAGKTTPFLPGDILVSIDGALPASDSEAQTVLYQVPEGSVLAVVVRRGTQDLHLSVGHGAAPTFLRNVKPR